MYEVVRWVHVGAGAVALLSFLVPAIARKGGPLHRRAGWVYAVAMGVVAATAGALCAVRLARGDAPAGPVFLLYLSWLAVSSVWTGLRALRHRRRTGPHTGVVDRVVPGVLAIGGIALGMWGLADRDVLRIGFGILGTVVGTGQLQYWRTAPTERMHWWHTHSGNLIGAGIATFTAFFVVNADRLGVPGLVAWFLPTLVGVPVIATLDARARRRFAGQGGVGASR